MGRQTDDCNRRKVPDEKRCHRYLQHYTAATSERSTGSTICRITSLVVSSQHRGHGLGQSLLTAAIDFAREHHCSGLEITSAEGRVDAHRFYRRLGFSRTSFRFFQAMAALGQ
jgi:GNAT superfamily N-acetyltransferase